MLPRQLRVGDLVDDYCPRERRLSNHAIVALVGEDVRVVRCTTCDTEHDYRGGKVPVSRKKPSAVAPPPLPPARTALVEPDTREPVASTPAAAGGTLPPPPGTSAAGASPDGTDGERAVPTTEAEPDAAVAHSPHAEVSLHRRLIRATLPRVEGEAPVRPIPEFTMHRAAATGHRHAKPFRHGQGGGQHRQGGKGGPNPGRPGGQRQGQGEVDGNSIHYRGSGQGQRGAHGGHGSHTAHGTHGGPGVHGSRGAHGSQGKPHGPRQGFGGRPPRGPRNH